MVRLDKMRRPPRGARRRMAFTDLDCELFDDSDVRPDPVSSAYGGFDPTFNPKSSPQEDSNGFREISFRAMKEVIKRSRDLRQPIDMVLAMDFSGNSQTAFYNQHTKEKCLPGIEKLITMFRTTWRLGLYVTGALELEFPLQFLVYAPNDDTKQHLLAQWRELMVSDVDLHLSSLAIGCQSVGAGRFITVSTNSFQNRTDLRRLIVNNWNTREMENNSSEAEAEAAPSLEIESEQQNHVSSDDESLDESKYEMISEDASWRDDGSEDWVDHTSMQESWDGVSDADSVLSLDNVQYSYADMVRFGRKLDANARSSEDALHHCPSSPYLGLDSPYLLPSIMEDSASLIVSDSDIRQQFVDLQQSISLSPDEDTDTADSIDAFDAKHERRGRLGGARPDGTMRWKRFK